MSRRLRLIQWPVARRNLLLTQNFKSRLIGTLTIGLVGSGALLYFLFPGLSWRLPASNPSDTSESSPLYTVTTVSPDDLTVGSYARIIRTSDIPGIETMNDGDQSGHQAKYSYSNIKFYPTPESATTADSRFIITGTVPIGSIYRIISVQSLDGSQWVQAQLCSIPSGLSSSDALSESDDTEQSLSTPESTDTDRPLILDLGATGWTLTARLAAVSELIQDLEPTQIGVCE